MSGTRNHYVPVFLQEGFAEKITNKQIYIWVCRKKTGAFKTTAGSTGVEGHFYIDNGNPAADDIVTEYEYQILELIAKLRTQQAGPIDDPGIAELIAHFEVRTRNLRETFRQSIDELTNGICDRFKNRDFAVQFTRDYLTKNPRAVLDSVEKEETFKSAPKWRQKILIRNAKKMDPMTFARSCDWSAIASTIAKNYGVVATEAAKRGHLRALNESAVPRKRAEQLKEFRFRLIDFEDKSLILGDSIVFFRLSNDRFPYRPFTDSSMQTERVYFPLSPSRLLVGAKQDDQLLDTNLAEAAARCSLEFVVSHSDSDFLRSTQQLIGSYTSIFNPNIVDQIVAQTDIQI